MINIGYILGLTIWEKNWSKIENKFFDETKKMFWIKHFSNIFWVKNVYEKNPIGYI
jgi:hypothetical protein